MLVVYGIHISEAMRDVFEEQQHAYLGHLQIIKR